MKFSEIIDQLKDFKEILETHYNDEGNLFTEDLIRYWFIKFFQGIDPSKNRNNTLIEEPYLREDRTKLKIKRNANLKKDKHGNNRCRADLYY